MRALRALDTACDSRRWGASEAYRILESLGGLADRLTDRDLRVRYLEGVPENAALVRLAAAD